MYTLIVGRTTIVEQIKLIKLSSSDASDGAPDEGPIARLVIRWRGPAHIDDHVHDFGLDIMQTSIPRPAAPDTLMPARFPEWDAVGQQVISVPPRPWKPPEGMMTLASRPTIPVAPLRVRRGAFGHVMLPTTVFRLRPVVAAVTSVTGTAEDQMTVDANGCLLAWEAHVYPHARRAIPILYWAPFRDWATLGAMERSLATLGSGPVYVDPPEELDMARPPPPPEVEALRAQKLRLLERQRTEINVIVPLEDTHQHEVADAQARGLPAPARSAELERLLALLTVNKTRVDQIDADISRLLTSALRRSERAEAEAAFRRDEATVAEAFPDVEDWAFIEDDVVAAPPPTLTRTYSNFVAPTTPPHPPSITRTYSNFTAPPPTRVTPAPAAAAEPTDIVILRGQLAATERAVRVERSNLQALQHAYDQRGGGWTLRSWTFVPGAFPKSHG